jgi:hypothetical protein
MTAQTQVIIDFIAGLGWDDRDEVGYPLLPGPFVPPSPDRLVVITGGGGPGYTTEEPATDGSSFQARLRGPAEDWLEAEAQAQALDDLILRARCPVQVDGTWVVHCSRLGNGPSPLAYDPTDQRGEFTCNYLIVTGV